MSRTKKTVVFANSNTTRLYEKTTADMITDVQIATETIVDFLGRTVEDVFSTSGKHYRTRERKSPQSPVNMSYVETKVYQSLHQLVHPHVPSNKSTHLVLDYLKANKQHKVSEIFVDAVSKRDNISQYSATVLIMLGLEPFVRYNQCMNECYKALEYTDTDDNLKPRIKPFGKEHTELKDACLNSHSRIVKAMGVSDIRQFDYFLRRASMNTCSLLYKPYKRVRKGGSRVVHTGPRGGKYTVVNGNKVYV